MSLECVEGQLDLAPLAVELEDLVAEGQLMVVALLRCTTLPAQL